jgi:hypothetical protein
MSLSTINQITSQTLTYAPAVAAAVTAAQQIRNADPSVTGPMAQHAVVSSVLTGIEVGSGALESSPNQTVAGIAQLVNLFVSLFQALNHSAFATAQKATA